MPSSKIAFIRTNTYRSEPRLIKVSSVAKEEGWDCWFVLWKRDDKQESVAHSFTFPLKAPFGKLYFIVFLPFWFCYTLFALIRIKPDLIHACDFEAAVPAYIYTRLRRIPFIYDLWDALIGRLPVKQTALRWLIVSSECFILKRADHILLPDPERAEQLPYLKNRVKDTTIIYNSDAPPVEKTSITFRPHQKLRLVYVGVMSKQIRGLEFIAATAIQFPDYTFDIAGYGPDNNYFTAFFNAHPAKNLTFHGRVSREEAHSLFQNGDIVLSLLDPRFENYRFATSTKVFEAFTHTKPVLTTRHTATGVLVGKTHWGMVIDYSESAFLDCLRQLERKGNEFLLDPKHVNSYCWPAMSKRLAKVYSQLIGTPDPALEE